MYQWIVDNDMTPHLLVDVSIDGVQVPSEHIQNGKIILNIAPMAISLLVLGDEDITFGARFFWETTELIYSNRCSTRSVRKRKWSGYDVFRRRWRRFVGR